MKEKEIKLPDTSDAEEWLTPDTFMFEGKVYKVLPKTHKFCTKCLDQPLSKGWKFCPTCGTKVKE